MSYIAERIDGDSWLIRPASGGGSVLVVILVLVLILKACATGVETPAPPDYLKVASPRPSAASMPGLDTQTTADGMRGLGRSMTSPDKLVAFANARIAPCGYPRKTEGREIAAYLPDGGAALLADVVVCEDSGGPILGIIRSGASTRFQKTYKKAFLDDPDLWKRTSHQIWFGNGFFVIGADVGETGLGLARLICEPDPYETHFADVADVPGCYFTQADQ
ncbi:hypothetical protein AB0B45_23540 [Nonomuraea sp. NPDC049152]|uniref:hypothetical protein n=1 Tax=Nonomuraea sp. NPDC049152 TaxID=3154350 RepID=UPI0033D8AB24